MTAVPFRFCRICGMRGADRHHIVSRGSGGADEPWNVIHLCREHHTEWHTLGWYKFCLRYPATWDAVLEARSMRGLRTTSREVRDA